MNIQKTSLLLIGLAGALLATGAFTGWWLATHHIQTLNKPESNQAFSSAGTEESPRKILYWYDPMQPQQHFDKPGPSPFMDMALIPKYAENEDTASEPAKGFLIDSAVSQNIAIRLTKAVSIPLNRRIEATGLIGFNERHQSVVQTRTGGFVERAYPLAEGDSVKAGQPLVELLVPEWAAAQQELLALRELGQDGLLSAARQRLRLLGMPSAMIHRLEASGKVQNRYTIYTPIAGVVQALEVRDGMTLIQGQTVANINGLATVWLETAVPEAQAEYLQPGDHADVELTAFPGKYFHGKVFDIVPTLNAGSRSVRVRIELDNPKSELRPGQSALVTLNAASESYALAVPTEAIIRTGKRSLVMLALEHGRYSPLEVKLGPEIGNRTVITTGLKEGQLVVASGQFLLDSEASLNGIPVQPAEPEMKMKDHAAHDIPPVSSDPSEHRHHLEGEQ